MKYYLSFVTLSGMMLLESSAQSEKIEESPPTARVSVMAYGFKPEPQFKLATEADIKRIVAERGELDEFGDSVADQLRGEALFVPPDKDVLPPGNLNFPLTEEQLKLGDPPETLAVGFNSVGSKKEIVAGININLNRDRENSPYVRIPALTKDTDNLLLLIPRGEAPKYWAKPPRVIHYNFSTEEYSEKSFVFKNLTRTDAQVEIDKQKVLIKPGKTHYFENLPTGKHILYRVSTDKGKSVIKYSRILLYDDRMFVQMLMPQHREVNSRLKYRLAQFIVETPIVPEPEIEDKSKNAVSELTTEP